MYYDQTVFIVYVRNITCYFEYLKITTIKIKKKFKWAKPSEIINSELRYLHCYQLAR